MAGKRNVLLLVALLVAPVGRSEEQPETLRHERLYRDSCASCHGTTLAGGAGPSLVDAQWQHGSGEDSVADIIRDGVGTMPAFGARLSEADIRSLVVYIRERASHYDPTANDAIKTSLPPDTVRRSRLSNFRAEPILQMQGTIWGFDFLPDGEMVISQREGGLLRRDSSGALHPIASGPKALVLGDMGVLDVAAHPDYRRNGWIYLAYVEAAEGTPDAGCTKIVRARIGGDRWHEEQVIFAARPDDRAAIKMRPGARLLFHQRHLFFSIGDGGNGGWAQDLTKPNGKIYRVRDDGSIPTDNPFIGRPGAYEAIWTYGNRNAHGLSVQPGTDNLFANEHGPRGGDELNQLRPGHNYGWPVATFGIDYSGDPVSDKTSVPGMDDPLFYWTPSPGVSGFTFYDGNAFEPWQGDILMATLATQQLVRIRLRDGKVAEEEVLANDLGRARTVRVAKDGTVYVAVANAWENPVSRIFRLVPADN